MPKFRKKPVVVEAFRLPAEDEDPTEELIEFLAGGDIQSDHGGGVEIHTLEGVIAAELISMVDGEEEELAPVIAYLMVKRWKDFVDVLNQMDEKS